MVRTSLISLMVGGLALGSAAVAQEQQAPDPSQETAPVQTMPADGQNDGPAASQGQAEQCRENLAAFVAQLNDEQFWVTGWGNMPGYGFGGVAGATPPATDQMATPAGQPAQAQTMQQTGMGNYGAMRGIQSPRGQIQVLYSAAHVFAEQNNQEGCDYVLGQLASTYERYRDELTAAGIDPAEVTGWRREQIALAQDVSSIEGIDRFTVDNLIGADIRSRADENLGSVNDVLVDPQSGDISHLIVARGGFLGIGEELVAVPWQAFAATPGLNTLVLDVEEQHLDAAPSIDSGFWTDEQSYRGLLQQSGEYWQTSNR